jgi:uncharacterized protein YecE (DUF72 family)
MTSGRHAGARIGCSGYDYADWRGTFYPDGLPERSWFAHYATRFDTVEVNATFYRLPEPGTVERWRDRAPDGFSYAVKLGRYGTHRKHLLDPQAWVPPFVERIRRLGATLGPVLAQLPPRWHVDPARLDAFLEVGAGSGVRWAVEVRDPSWLCDDVYEILARHNAALCIHDLIAHHPRIVTADWVYLRFHGTAVGRPYAGSYSPQALSGAARRIRRHLAEGRDVYAYFNNDIGAAAPADAATLRRSLGRGRPPSGQPV